MRRLFETIGQRGVPTGRSLGELQFKGLKASSKAASLGCKV